MSRLECYIKAPCPAMRTEGERDYCTKEEGKCEYQILSIEQSEREESRKKCGGGLIHEKE